MNYSWKPITPLSQEDKAVDLSDVDSLKEAWASVRDKLTASSPKNLKEFNERLARQWSVETGILERIYDIDRGTTKVLIEHGFLAGYIERSSTNLEPEQLIEILRDHKAAIDLIHDCIARSRRLTVGLVHELHSILTRHQSIVEAIDSFGKMVSFQLKRGSYKDLPNNLTRPDGTIHEYCPPIHVSSEMEKLLKWYEEYGGLNPVLVAAWLHHRFTQIHPYQDGNGRVARALANLVLIKGEFFPVVINRDQRSEYIDALEQADVGCLKVLIRSFAEIQKKTILEALSIAPDTKPSSRVVEGVVDAIATKLRRRKEEVTQTLRRVNSVAEELQKSTEQYLRKIAQNVRSQLNAVDGIDVGVQVLLGGPNNPYNGKPTEHWYHYQVAMTAHQANQRANFDEHHYFVRVRLSSGELPWLDFVVSFHHIGQDLSGVMEVTAFAEISYPTSDEEKPKAGPLQCMDKPFTITYRDNPDTIRPRFFEWINETFAIAVKKWGDTL